MGGKLKLLIALIVVSVAIGRSQWVGAIHDHVVGGDRGWESSSDIHFWASTRVFSVGDKIWFTYSAAQENVVELKSQEEYEACDVNNPIKMYTNGLDSVPLEEEGIRYFASGKPESCKNGLRLHVAVQPQAKHHHGISAVVTSEGSAGAIADAPTSPSISTRISGHSCLLFVGILVCHLINQGL